jgi:GNAT superfamily N-acetyltransferase
MNISFKEITMLADKRKWMKRFFRDYSGEYKKENPNMYLKTVKFVIVVSEDKELGFARINDKSGFFANQTSDAVWNLTDAYVKPAYRGKGVLRELISHLIANYNVKMLYMETDRFHKNLFYYQTLGFTKYYTVQNDLMVWAFLKEFWPVVEPREATHEND